MEEWIEKIERLLPLVQEYVLSLEEKNKELMLQVEELTGQLQEITQLSQQQEQKYQALKIIRPTKKKKMSGSMPITKSR